jgi:hypothetical protein
MKNSTLDLFIDHEEEKDMIKRAKKLKISLLYYQLEFHNLENTK